MKRSSHRGGRQAARAPREIRVRMASPRVAEGQPDVWVVKGRVIRFLDPSRPEDVSGLEHGHGRLGGLFGALRPRRRHQGHARG